MTFSTEEAVGTPCTVCGAALPPIHHTVCEACSGTFHFRMTESAQALDCGYVYLDEQQCTTVFLCAPCYGKHVLGEDVSQP